MAWTIQTKRETSSPRPIRGIPSLATDNIPILETHADNAPGEKLPEERSLTGHKTEKKSVPSTIKGVPRINSFNFLGLPAELRLKIYEICVFVTEYITYDEKDYCTCGAQHIHQHHARPGHGCTYITPIRSNYGFRRRQPGHFYLISPIIYSDTTTYINARTTPTPSILEANSQIRAEALPVFYRMNDFCFENCEPEYLTRWIYGGIQPEHLKYVKSIIWNGILGWSYDNTVRLDDSDEISAVLMLLQLGILGQCKIRLTVEGHEFFHVGCILRQKILELVQRKELTSSYAENEDSKLDSRKVYDLVSSVAQDFTDWWKQVLKHKALEFDQNNREIYYCDCTVTYDYEEMPWLTMKSLPCANKSDRDPVSD